MEGARGTRHGVVLVRVGAGSVGLIFLGLHLTGRLRVLVYALPTTWLVDTMRTDRWPWAALVLVAACVVAVWFGRWPVTWALGLPPREQLRVDSDVHEVRPAPDLRWGSPELALLRRLDRGSVGMRRGLVVLGLGPGLVALVAGLTWSSVMLLPGLAASSAALLFCVNAWCLDGKAWCGEKLPPLPVAAAVGTCWLVVVVQVLTISMSWSVRSPHSADLSSPRATPAPHAVMASYAGRLSLVTTVTGMIFAALSVVGVACLTPAVGSVFLLWSGVRLRRLRRRWHAPAHRARIALTVAAV